MGSRRAPDHGIADAELRPFPLTLGEALYPTDHDVRSQPPDVAAELGYGAVGRNEERENVEPGEPVERDEFRVIARRSLHERERLRGVPRMTVDERPTGGIERAVQAEEMVLTARRAYPLRAANVDDPVAGDTVCCQLGRLEALTRERLYGIPPELLDEEAHCDASIRTAAASRAATIGSHERSTAASTMPPSRRTPTIRPSRSGSA